MRLREHIEQALAAVDMVDDYAVEGSPEALLAGAVRHLAAAIAELGGGRGQPAAT